MNALLPLAFTALTATLTPTLGSGDTTCPSGLPTELFVDCVVADSAARSEDRGPAYFDTESYNVTEQLQAWVDRQMRRDIARDNTEPSGSDVAQQLD